jgi:hypothetical protein
MVKKLVARSEIPAVTKRLKQPLNVVPRQWPETATKNWRLWIWPYPGIPWLSLCKQLTALDRTKTGKLMDCETVNALRCEFRNVLTQTCDNLRLVAVNQEDFRFWEILDVHRRVKWPNDQKSPTTRKGNNNLTPCVNPKASGGRPQGSPALLLAFVMI